MFLESGNELSRFAEEFQCEGKAGDNAFQLKGETALEHLDTGDLVTFKAANGVSTGKKHKVVSVLLDEHRGTFLQLEGEDVNEIKPPGAPQGA